MAGERGSQWRVILRCLALLRRLMRDDASADELIALIAEHDDDGADRDALDSRLEGDLKRLRMSLDCDIAFIHTERVYRLIGMRTELIDLSDSALDALAFLQTTFSGSDIPQGETVLRLIREVARALPEERQTEIARRRSGLEVTLRSRDSQPIDTDLIERLTYACNAHQEIQFIYRSPKQADQQPRTHRVEPLRVYLDATRHHHMLEAFYLESNGPYGPSYYTGYRTYRLERMSDLKVLPKKFVPRTTRPPGEELVYVLSPALARLRDVSGVLEDSVITYEPDGSAIVRAISHNLLMDLKQLLHYGAECQVIGGTQAVSTMRALVRGLAGVYGEG